MNSMFWSTELKTKILLLLILCITLLVACAPAPAAVPNSTLPEFPYGSVDTAGVAV